MKMISIISVNKWFKHDPFLVIRDEIHDCLMIFEKQLKTYHFLVVEKVKKRFRISTRE